MNLISQTHEHVRHFFFKLTIKEMNDINDPKLKCSIIGIKCINFEVNRFSCNFGILLPSLSRQIVKLMKLIFITYYWLLTKNTCNELIFTIERIWFLF